MDEVGILKLAEPVLLAGAPLDQARHAMVLIHGRGATANDILSLTPAFENDDFAYLAPQAPHNTWYPYPFTAPLAENEPSLSASLSLVDGIVNHLIGAGFSPDRLILLGFSQGACLTLEYAARHAQRYGALVGLSGGLIGPDNLPRSYQGSFAGTPVFLGCSDVDPHIPKHRVQHAADVLAGLGAAVTMRLYPNMAHTVNDDEVNRVRALMSALQSG